MISYQPITLKINTLPPTPLEKRGAVSFKNLIIVKSLV